MAKNIFDIDKELYTLYDEIEEAGGEITPEIEEKLEINGQEITNKVKNITNFINNLNADILAIKSETDRLAKLKKSKENTIKGLTNLVLFVIKKYGTEDKSGKKWIDWGTGKVTIRKSETIKVALVLSNNRNVGVHARVNKLGVPSFVFSREEFVDGEPVLAKLAEYDTDLIVLAGFMNKISDPLLNAYPGKIINIHPALLPKYGGKGMYGMHVHEAVVAAGERETGITIHYIDEHYDEGTVIFQATCPVLPFDTPEEVAAKVHALEYAHYPKIIEDLLATR